MGRFYWLNPRDWGLGIKLTIYLQSAAPIRLFTTPLSFPFDRDLGMFALERSHVEEEITSKIYKSSQFFVKN